MVLMRRNEPGRGFGRRAAGHSDWKRPARGTYGSRGFPQVGIKDSGSSARSVTALVHARSLLRLPVAVDFRQADRD